MLEEGLVEEFKRLAAQFSTSRALGAIGYAQVKDYLAGSVPPGRKLKPGIQGLQDEIALATRQLVKQQRTWFKGLMSQVPASKSYLLENDQAFLEEALDSVYKG
jgi:tRNA A37 N6-isopentenylltransferase MiaA